MKPREFFFVAVVLAALAMLLMDAFGVLKLSPFIGTVFGLGMAVLIVEISRR